MDDLRQPTDEPTEADPLISGPISTSTAVRDALTEMFGDAWQEWSDEATGAAAAVLMWLSSNDRLVGGRPAAPTREQIDAKAIRWANQFARKASDAGTHFTEEGVLTLAESFADAVVALLSRSAAEPPGDAATIAAAAVKATAGHVYAAGYEQAIADGVAAEPNEETTP